MTFISIHLIPEVLRELTYSIQIIEWKWHNMVSIHYLFCVIYVVHSILECYYPGTFERKSSLRHNALLEKTCWMSYTIKTELELN